MRLAFVDYFEQVESIINSAATLIKRGECSEQNKLLQQVESAKKRLFEESRLRVTLLGEFSSGKSSLISALTGAEVPIDADVATDRTTHYEWRGVDLIDTPGIQSDSTDNVHDKIAKEATVNSDLILFVITNELFGPRLADYLHYILDAEKLNLSKRTCIAINKIDREINPIDTLMNEVAKVLDGYQNIPIFVCAASKALQARYETSPLSDKFFEQSMISQLVEGIDDFIKMAGTTAKLSAPITIINDALYTMQMSLSSDADKGSVAAIQKSRRIIQRLQRTLREIRKARRQEAYSAIMKPVNEALEQITETFKPEDADRLFEEEVLKIQPEIELLLENINSDLITEIDKTIDELKSTETSIEQMDASMTDKLSNDSQRLIIDGDVPGKGPIFEKFMKSLGGPLQDALEKAALDTKGLKQVYLKVGKTIGKKFRPWQAKKGAEKLGKVLSKGGKAIPVITTALDYWIELRTEKAKENKARYVANIRLALRKAFANQAKLTSDIVDEAIADIVNGPIKKSMDDLDNKSEMIRSKDTIKDEILIEIKQTIKTSNELLEKLYDRNDEDNIIEEE